MGTGVYSVWKAVPSGTAMEVRSEGRFERAVGGEIGPAEVDRKIYVAL